MPDRRMPDLPPTPRWFKVWFAIYAFVALVVLGVVIWAIVAVVNHYT